MTASGYEEILEGETFCRKGPDARHEIICARLHAAVAESISRFPSARLLEPRSIVQLSPGTMVRPDLAIITAVTSKLWLAGEVISSLDHKLDTVNKKSLYEESRLPRLWMIDPRYDNVEIYHGGPYGLSLRGILAGQESLQETLLPSFGLVIKQLFAEK